MKSSDGILEFHISGLFPVRVRLERKMAKTEAKHDRLERTSDPGADGVHTKRTRSQMQSVRF